MCVCAGRRWRRHFQRSHSWPNVVSSALDDRMEKMVAGLEWLPALPASAADVLELDDPAIKVPPAQRAGFLGAVGREAKPRLVPSEGVLWSLRSEECTVESGGEGRDE